MTIILTFITYIAWPVSVLCSLLFALTFWNWIGEDSRVRVWRVARGETFPFITWGLPAVISILWLAAYYN